MLNQSAASLCLQCSSFTSSSVFAVFMGMGEPLLNVNNVVQAVRIINKQFGIGARNITISTVGVRKQIGNLAQHGLQCTLAVSLHAPTQVLRCVLSKLRPRLHPQFVVDAECARKLC
jgi:23S rRNA (adenine2503-C2)-methyltransferase